VAALSGNNNAVLFDSCAHLQNLTVSLQVTQDLITVGNNGFSLQLNAYPQTGFFVQGEELNWFQYFIYVENDSLWWEVQYWSIGAKLPWPSGIQGAPGTTPWLPAWPNDYQLQPFGNAPGSQVVAGTTLEIQLTTTNGNVTTAAFSVTGPVGNFSAEFPIPQNALAPIYGFQLDVVGPGNFSTSNFTSGVGVLSYSVSPGVLSVQSGGPTCGGLQPPTGEQSNAVYGAVTPSSGSPVAQSMIAGPNGWTDTIFNYQAAPGSGLTCFGVNGQDSRIYYLDPEGNVWELGWNGASWFFGNLMLEAAGFPAPANGTALNCVGVNSTNSRVYYLDNGGNVWELGWNGDDWFPWYASNVTSQAAPSWQGPGSLQPAASGSALTCFEVQGTNSRVYYLDANGNVWELGWNGSSWFAGNITSQAGAVWQGPGPLQPAASGSALTCFGVGGTNSRIYYLDGNGNVWELGWSGSNWYAGNVTAQATGGPPPAASGSALTCFAVNGQNSRIYYLDGNGNVWELGWNGSNWYAGNVTAQATGAPPPAASRSALSCFGQSGTESRVYYFDSDDNVWELGWNGSHWYAGNVTAQATGGPPRAVSGGGLTCFGWNGTDSRIYYLGPTFTPQTGLVWELGWNGTNWFAGNAWAQAAATWQGPGQLQPPASDSALTCFGVNGQNSRVYYFDSSGNVWELGWNGSNWYAGNVWAHAAATWQGPGQLQAAAAGSALTCFGVNGQNSRVYYFDSSGNVWELGWNGSNWYAGNVWAQASGSPLPAAPGSALTCFGVNGTDSRVYYFDSSGNVWELGWNGSNWYAGNVTAQATGAPPPAASGSALTCFGANGENSRIYYLGTDGNVWELGWNGSNWFAGNVWAQAAAAAQSLGFPPPPLAASRTPLTCFGQNGTDSRVYYLDANGDLNEFAWENGWAPAFDISSAIGIAPEPVTKLTCFGLAGQKARVYLLSDQNAIAEVAWLGQAPGML
jgi:hypothetical protein